MSEFAARYKDCVSFFSRQHGGDHWQIPWLSVSISWIEIRRRVVRVRVKGVPSLIARAEIDTGAREFWTLKECVGQMIWDTISPPLARLLPDEALRTVKTEWDVGMYKDGISGVYPIGGKWGDTHIFDVRLKCGLQALRINHLIKTTVAPKLKEACGSDANAPQIRVPLSQGEMRRKRLRAEGASERGRSRDRRRAR